MDNVQNYDSYINIAQSQIYRSYLACPWTDEENTNYRSGQLVHLTGFGA
jgi:hypothetical protein